MRDMCAARGAVVAAAVAVFENKESTTIQEPSSNDDSFKYHPYKPQQLKNIELTKIPKRTSIKKIEDNEHTNQDFTNIETRHLRHEDESFVRVQDDNLIKLIKHSSQQEHLQLFRVNDDSVDNDISNITKHFQFLETHDENSQSIRTQENSSMKSEKSNKPSSFIKIPLQIDDGAAITKSTHFLQSTDQSTPTQDDDTKNTKKYSSHEDNTNKTKNSRVQDVFSKSPQSGINADIIKTPKNTSSSLLQDGAKNDINTSKNPSFIRSQFFLQSQDAGKAELTKNSPFSRTQDITTTEVATILLNKLKKSVAENGRPEDRPTDNNNVEHAGEEDMSETKNSVCPGDPVVSQYHRTDEERDTCCGFESAVKDFDMTAEDVQKFVAESMRSISNDRKKAELKHESEGKTESERCEDTDTTSDDCTISETDDSEDCMLREGLATIAEEVTASSVHSSDDEADGSSEASTSPDEDGTVKGSQEKWCNGSTRTGSSSDMSSTSSERTNHLKDSSTRCNGDFQWICKEPVKEKKNEECLPMTKPPINRRERTPRRSVEKTPPGSLDRRRHHQQSRQERDQKSKSSHVLKSPPRLEDFIGAAPCKNWCCSPHQDYYFDFHRRHERMDPQRYGSNPMLMDRFLERGSHPDLYGERIRHENMGCSCAYHIPPPPPCYYYGGDGRGYHWTPTKPPDQDERMRKLQAERDNLQLQVQVLTEQIEAQGDKIGDLEKNLNEKKQQLISSEDLLQREMLSRSSLETQKLELMTTISELKLQHAALERENLELRNTAQLNNNSTVDGIKKPPFMPRASPQPTLTSTPVHGSNQTLRKSPSPSPVTVNPAGTSPRRVESTTQELQSPKTPPSNYRRQIELQYASLPRQQFLSNGGTSLSVVDSNANPANGVRKGVAFGMGLSSLLGGRARGQSVPNLADTEKIVIDEQNGDSPQSPSIQGNKNKGIKKIFGKIKRSGSGNLEDFGMSCGEFQRGGVRATASARLGWSDPIPTIKPDKPFMEWDTENICDWLQDLGLDQYVPDAKKWVKSGQQLLEANINEIEKELVIKNPLHKKKLQLALIDTEENSSSDPFLPKAGKLDTAWVLRWLDDTGLPQYKETFLLNRIDGRVLHRLTMDDLALLHVTSMLHVASIKRGIQVLRENNYDAGCLQRRSLPDDPEMPTPKQVSLWTTHRVMEWLRAVDLAEYAPNLRGAGVHGGLLVHENKFTAELLAALLSIPPGKTLLRRHLNTHFNALLGKDIIQAKREAEATLGYIPLTPASKLKVAKKSHFSLKRNKSKSEADYGDLVCPLNQNSGEICQNGSTFNNSMGMMKMNAREEVAYLLAEEESFSSSSTSSPLPERHNR